MNRKIFYIGGSPCSGKSTIAELFAKEYGAYYFKVDDVLNDFIAVAAEKNCDACKTIVNLSADENRLRDPREQCEEEFSMYQEIKTLVFEKLESVESKFIIAEGAAFTPEVTEDVGYEHYLCVIPTPNFQISHYKQREWIEFVLKECVDKQKAFDNWMQRDIFFAEQVKRNCDKNGIFCMINDGSRAPKELYEIVKCNFGL